MSGNELSMDKVTVRHDCLCVIKEESEISIYMNVNSSVETHNERDTGFADVYWSLPYRGPQSEFIRLPSFSILDRKESKDPLSIESEMRHPGGGRHHFAPDDEGAFEYENYRNPDHTY
jgi:hypothetical protein